MATKSFATSTWSSSDQTNKIGYIKWQTNYQQPPHDHHPIKDSQFYRVQILCNVQCAMCMIVCTLWKCSEPAKFDLPIEQCSSSNQTFSIIFPTHSNAMQDSLQSVKVKTQVNLPLVFSPAPLLQLLKLPIPFNHDDGIKYKIQNQKYQMPILDKSS